jgi:hypothetical protein
LARRLQDEEVAQANNEIWRDMKGQRTHYGQYDERPWYANAAERWQANARK